MANAVRRILLQRIANYFLEWDGEDKTAPTMQLHIDELRAISSMHTELCRLEGENKRLKDNESVKGDLISRSQVIKTIWNLFNNWGNNAIRFSEDETRLINTAFQMVQRDIEKLPTAYNDEWIPVSIGKYPEAEEEVLICDDMNNLYIGYLRNVGFYVNDGDGWIDKKYVIAWKPLPPAYQPKGE